MRKLCTGAMAVFLLANAEITCIAREETEWKIGYEGRSSPKPQMILQDEETEEDRVFAMEDNMTVPLQSGHVYRIRYDSLPPGILLQAPETVRADEELQPAEISEIPVSVRLIPASPWETVKQDTALIAIADEEGKETARWKWTEEKDMPEFDGVPAVFRAGKEYTVRFEEPQLPPFSFHIPVTGDARDADFLFSFSGQRLRQMNGTVLVNGEPSAMTDWLIFDDEKEHPRFSVHTDEKGCFSLIMEDGEYTLQAAETMQGYYACSPVRFHASDQVIRLIAEPVKASVALTDSASKEKISGMPVCLKDDSGKILAEWESDGADALQTHALLEKGRNYSVECMGEKEGYVLHEKSIQIHIPQTCPETEPSAEFVFDPVIIPEPVLPEMTEPQEPAVQPAEEVKEPEKPEKKEEKKEPEKPAEEPAQVRRNVPVYIPPAVPEEIRIPEKQKDPAFSVRVIDEYGQALSNVQVAVLDSAGSPVDQWYSETQAHTVGSQVMLGETYRIHQISAPPGYQLNRTDIEFTMPQEMPQEDIVLTLRCRKAAEETPEDSTAGTGRKKVSPLLPFTLSAAATAGLLSGLYRKLRIRQP